MIKGTLFSTFRHFFKNKIFLPVSSRDLVLDVGGREKPFWRGDVVVDKFSDHEISKTLMKYNVIFQRML